MDKRRWIWIGVGLGALLCVILPLVCLGMSMLSLSGGTSAGRMWEDAVAVVRIEGVIVSGQEPDFPLTTSACLSRRMMDSE